MATSFKSGTLSSDIYRLKKEVEEQIQQGRDAQNPWEIILGKWDEMAERMKYEDPRNERDRGMRNVHESYKRLRNVLPKKAR